MLTYCELPLQELFIFHCTAPWSSLPIMNHKYQTYLILMIPSRAASDGIPAIANEKEQRRKRPKLHVAHFYHYKHNGQIFFFLAKWNIEKEDELVHPGNNTSVRIMCPATATEITFNHARICEILHVINAAESPPLNCCYKPGMCVVFDCEGFV